MTTPTGTAPDPEAWGIELRFQDVNKQWREASPETVQRILEAMGADSPAPQGAGHDSPVLVFVKGEAAPSVEGSWVVTTEEGGTVEGEGPLPDDLPLGYHSLRKEGAAEDVLLIVAPSSCPDTRQLRWWGFAVQLYALRSRSSWGMGDLGDLSELAGMAAEEQANMLIVNPLHASLPGVPQQDSPYFPSSREFRNPLYIDVRSVAGAGRADVALDELERQAHALNADRRIDRDAVWRLKEDALERIWRHTEPDAAFEAFVQAQGEALLRYAVFCVLTEQHGRPWQRWPSELRHPDSPAVHEAAQRHSDRVRFHQWLQWLLDRQLQEAGSRIGLVHDLAIGVDPAGADAWLWQDSLALDMRVGAPPDGFNTQGQDWGLPPFDPWRLRAQKFEPFIRVVRSSLRAAGGLRVDHVMGLFRLYWIPEGMSATDGAYVKYPWQEMLAIVALESHRAGAHVVGEDLGTVEPYMREEMKKRNILSYRLLWFEEEPPSKFPTEALAAVTTHDLPTIVGLWSGWDLELQQRLGTHPNVDGTKEMKDRVSEWVGESRTDTVEDVVRKTHRLLGEASSVMVTATLEDALGVKERPNYPGTTDEWPNWSMALPAFLEDLRSHPGFKETAEALREGRQHIGQGEGPVS